MTIVALLIGLRSSGSRVGAGSALASLLARAAAVRGASAAARRTSSRSRRGASSGARSRQRRELAAARGSLDERVAGASGARLDAALRRSCRRPSSISPRRSSTPTSRRFRESPARSKTLRCNASRDAHGSEAYGSLTEAVRSLREDQLGSGARRATSSPLSGSRSPRALGRDPAPSGSSSSSGWSSTATSSSSRRRTTATGACCAPTSSCTSRAGRTSSIDSKAPLDAYRTRSRPRRRTRRAGRAALTTPARCASTSSRARPEGLLGAVRRRRPSSSFMFLPGERTSGRARSTTPTLVELRDGRRRAPRLADEPDRAAARGPRTAWQHETIAEQRAGRCSRSRPRAAQAAVDDGRRTSAKVGRSLDSAVTRVQQDGRLARSARCCLGARARGAGGMTRHRRRTSSRRSTAARVVAAPAAPSSRSYPRARSAS